MTTKHQLFAFDFATYSVMGNYSFETAAEMMKEIGYDGIGFGVWDGARWQTTSVLAGLGSRKGIAPVAVYVSLDLSQGSSSASNVGVLRMLESMEDCKTVHMSIRDAGSGYKSGDARGDTAVTNYLKPVLEICERRGIDLLLYPHLFFWMDKHDVALRLCQAINHPRLGIVFTGAHWFAGEPGNPAPLLKRLMPYMKMMNLTGSSMSPLGWARTMTMEALDMGTCDNLALVGVAKRLGYTGPLGFLSYDDSGNPMNKMKRSYDELVKMVDLAERHPDWWDHLIGPV